MQKERSWTEQQLREVVAQSLSYRAVLRALGLRNGSLGYLQCCIAEAGLDTSHFKSNTKAPTRISDDQLRDLVPQAENATEVLRRAGLTIKASNFHRLRKRIATLGIDTSHWGRGRWTRKTRWTDEQLRAAVATSISVAETIRAVGLIAAGGNYDQIQRRIRELDIDTSHFLGMGWNKGGKFQARVAVPIGDLLVAGRPVSSHHLKERLFKEGLKKRECELCGWCMQAAGGRIPLELDHINGDKLDNRLENLRVLCPNCHSLQPTHRGLNKKSRRSRASEAFEGTVWEVGARGGTCTRKLFRAEPFKGPEFTFLHSRVFYTLARISALGVSRDRSDDRRP
jgi:hypothetical protein